MQVLTRTTPEQRSPFYEDVETLISLGFLSHPVTVQGVSLVFRSLGPGDIFMLQTRIGKGTLVDWQKWVVASSVWMVNGYSLLGEVNAAPRMVTTIERLPPAARDILFSLVMGLFTRQNLASRAIEPYCYEGASRFKWKSFGGQIPTAHTGIPGGERIGTNHVQRMWIFFNEIEDQRVRDEIMWEGFKLTASAQAPKGVKKLDQADKQRKDSEEQRRQALQDKFYYTQIGILAPDGKPKEKSATAYVSGTKSVEDLEEEMRRWVAGEEDWHDKVVNEYKREVVQRYQADKKAREARAVALKSRLDQEGLSPLSTLVGYTAEQLKEILKNRQQGRPGVREVFSGGHGSRDYLYEKYLEIPPDAGRLEVRDGRLVPREGADLTEQLAGRAVPFSIESEEED